MGLRTGIDLDKLIAARSIIAEGLPGEPIYGHVPDAGLPKGFVRCVDQGGGMSATLPLDGIRVVEFVHMVMGPTCGLLLGDLGAEVIKVEPMPEGDNTRRLTGSGAGFWPTYNRNKKSLAVNLKSREGMEIVKKLIPTADA